ncbi:DgyrCDS14219 [Dimorphilus gyrociliatus]|uniref:DgyrCDS14219 n=1 Tax=Dimorphilus gyrociliatus TaxID=2664684 RepID=A0A7I8WD04_9ANNE|nr:DgyrCDS14219 [Dimorphilus gyrociliatus]
MLGEENPAKARVAFGATGDREVFPTHVPHNKIGAELNPIRGCPEIGPGTYENEKQTNFQYEIDNFITSKEGYSLGARTANRFPKTHKSDAPAPTAYQSDNTSLRTFETAYKPFCAASKRFKDDSSDEKPSPGAYEHELKLNRKVEWHQSFGSAPINLPSASKHSTIGKNTDKLKSTKEEKKFQRNLAYLKLYY